MIEVIILVLIVITPVLVTFVLNANQPKYSIAEKEQLLLMLKDKLSVVEKKFFQGKLSEAMFLKLKEDLEFEIVLTELSALRLKKSGTIIIEDKFNKLLQKFKRPTKYKKAKLRLLLHDLETTKKELRIIEKKFFRKEILQSTFEKLLHLKENEIITKEIDIVHLLQDSSQNPASTTTPNDSQQSNA